MNECRTHRFARRLKVGALVEALGATLNIHRVARAKLLVGL